MTDATRIALARAVAAHRAATARARILAQLANAYGHATDLDHAARAERTAARRAEDVARLARRAERESRPAWPLAEETRYSAEAHRAELRVNEIRWRAQMAHDRARAYRAMMARALRDKDQS